MAGSGGWSGGGPRTLAVLSLIALLGWGAPARLARAEDEGEPAGAGPTTAAPRGWRIWWDEGVRVEVERPDLLPESMRWWEPQGRTVLLEGKLGALLQLDGSGYAADTDMGLPAGGLEARRVHLIATGTLSLALPVGFKLELGVTGDSVFLNDWFVEVREVPWLGTVRAGQVKAPFSLEELTSAGETTFMERAAAVEAFAPAYKAGVLVFNQGFGGRATGAVGWFSDGTATDTGNASESLSRLTGRVTWLPYEDTAGPGSLVHLGLDGSGILWPGGDVRYRSRPESHRAPRLVDTGVIDADHAVELGLEAALVHGPFSLQGEAIVALVEPKAGSLLEFFGYYLYGSWFLTGESRAYDRRSGVFSRVLPHASFSPREGRPGAWEVGVRWSHLDLSDGPIRGGRQSILSAVVNWYVSPTLRVTLEGLFGRVASGAADGDFQAVQSRLQLRF
jgi:phosphate-selective porin OprO/OprP